MEEFMSEDIRKRVRVFLEKEGREAHASEIAEALKLRYQQVYRALMMLAADGVVERRRAGRKVILWRAKGAVK